MRKMMRFLQLKKKGKDMRGLLPIEKIRKGSSSNFRSNILSILNLKLRAKINKKTQVNSCRWANRTQKVKRNNHQEGLTNPQNCPQRSEKTPKYSMKYKIQKAFSTTLTIKNTHDIIVNLNPLISAFNLISDLQTVKLILYIIMKQSKLDYFHKFISKEQERTKIPISGEVQACFDYCEYVIRIEFDKSSKTKYKFKKRKGVVSEDFMRAFNELKIEDKIVYYNKNVAYLVRINNRYIKPPQVENTIKQTEAFIRSLSLKRWRKKTIRLDSKQKIMFTMDEEAVRQYNLGNYLFRGSKNIEYPSFVLQSINDKVNSKAKTVHIGFSDFDKMIEWGNAIQLCIDYKHWERIYRQVLKEQPNPKQIRAFEEKLKEQSIQVKQQQVQKAKQVEKQKQIQEVISQQPSSKQPQEIKKVEAKSQIDEIPIDEQMMNNIGNRNQGEEAYRKTIVDHLLDSEEENQELQEIEAQDNQVKNFQTKINMFYKIFPDYDLDQLEDQTNMKMLQFQDGIFRIMQDISTPERYKLVIDLSSLSVASEKVFKAISGPHLLAEYNSNIEQISSKTFISSENSAIIYMKTKPFSKLYRARDYVFIRHSFRNSDKFYIADHKINNINFPPFMTIVRGQYSCIWGIIPQQKGCLVIADLEMKNQGYLNQKQNTNLVFNFIKGFTAIRTYLKQYDDRITNYTMFDVNWDISNISSGVKSQAYQVKKKSLLNINSAKLAASKSFAKRSMLQIEQNRDHQPKVEDQIKIIQQMNIRETFHEQAANQDIHKDQLQQKHELDPVAEQQKIILSKAEIKLLFDANGQFIQHPYKLTPQSSSITYLEPTKGKHPIWRGQWEPDQKQGGLLYVDEKKMEDQKGVLKFVLAKIGKNLLSGKSVLNISLPVDIFCPQSNLQLFTYSMTYAPLLLEPSVNKSPLQKFKSIATLGLSLSTLYIRMQKPFNPILGETFQAWINGCPAYAEQISHHPPISALLFYGRGYRIDAQLQSKVELHMNSGCGTNQGIFKFIYDSGQEICFTSPGGELSGLTYGERKFNIVGRSYVWFLKAKIFMEIIFNPNKKGFFSVGKQQRPIDYFQGQVCEVKPEFFMKFDPRKKKGPSENEIIKKLGKLHGIWHKKILFGDEVLLDYDATLPIKMEYESAPLPSDANWRQDIAYRRLNQISRAQNQKERLENIQRKDRKLRQKQNN